MSARKSLLHYSDPMQCHAHRPCRLENAVEYNVHGNMYEMNLPYVSSLSSKVSVASLSITKGSWSSLVSPGRRKPRENPGGTVRSPLLKDFLFESSADRSSSPPGQKGTYPDLPRTKLFVGAGARSREVEVNPVGRREDGIC